MMKVSTIMNKLCQYKRLKSSIFKCSHPYPSISEYDIAVVFMYIFLYLEVCSIPCACNSLSSPAVPEKHQETSV